MIMSLYLFSVYIKCPSIYLDLFKFHIALNDQFNVPPSFQIIIESCDSIIMAGNMGVSRESYASSPGSVTNRASE